ncbi:MAG: SapC family protein [Pseudomonadota bacterium]
MVRLVALDSVVHRDLRIDPHAVVDAVARERTVPVAVCEFAKVATQHPIVFTKSAATGRFVAVAMMGFEEGENLLVEQGEWQGAYIPLNLARQPFFLGHDSASEGAPSHYTVCVDMDSAAICSEPDPGRTLRVFEEDGDTTDYYKRTREMLLGLLADGAVATTLIDTLLEYKLLTPIQLDITLRSEASMHIDGLYTVDESALDAASGEMLAALQRRGLLKALYTIIVSLEQIPALIERKNRRPSSLRASG